MATPQRWGGNVQLKSTAGTLKSEAIAVHFLAVVIYTTATVHSKKRLAVEPHQGLQLEDTLVPFLFRKNF